MSHHEKVLDTLVGRWKSQIFYTGVKLDIFETVVMVPKHGLEIARELGLDYPLTYRLLRALASIGFLSENNENQFSVTPMGELVRKDHPQTLRGVILLEEGPEHYAVWKHLPEMVKDGKQDGFMREFGLGLFDYLSKNSSYRDVFNYAMSSYSATHSRLVLEGLKSYDFTKFKSLCDIGGGHGYLICNILRAHPELQGIVLELESAIKDKELLWAEKMGVADRCKYLGGDMFQDVPSSDLYMLKMILHDWNDEECIKILGNIQKASPAGGRVLIVEHIVPGPETSHFSKLFDIHMMCALTGKERTEEEYASLLEMAGLQYLQTYYPPSRAIGIIEGAKR